MTRQEHLDWCKQRALEYVQQGDFEQAVTSMLSDLQTHPETQDHCGIELGMHVMFGSQLNTRAEVIRFINGFN
jgi:hypothetical protein